ncbi:hypothetical protein LINPERHAP2_LOCUS38500 [Linum perenne]
MPGCVLRLISPNLCWGSIRSRTLFTMLNTSLLTTFATLVAYTDTRRRDASLQKTRSRLFLSGRKFRLQIQARWKEIVVVG